MSAGFSNASGSILTRKTKLVSSMVSCKSDHILDLLIDVRQLLPFASPEVSNFRLFSTLLGSALLLGTWYLGML